MTPYIFTAKGKHKCKGIKITQHKEIVSPILLLLNHVQVDLPGNPPFVPSGRSCGDSLFQVGQSLDASPAAAAPDRSCWTAGLWQRWPQHSSVLLEHYHVEEEESPNSFLVDGKPMPNVCRSELIMGLCSVLM
jgi:hypothetical protein